MAGRTISAHADADTARLVEATAKAEDRAPSQIVTAALKFYLRLPAEAREAIRTLDAFAAPQEAHAAMRRVSRVLLDASFGVSEARMVAQLRLDDEARLRDDKAILAEAVRLTRR